MSIIEKLGIKTPDELRLVKDCFKVFELAGFNVRFTPDIFDKAEKLKKILDDKNELLESMIDACKTIEWEKGIKAIENVCYPMKWPEIKELL